MLVNQREEILLEKRPSTGIWGSLWAFPELEETQTISTYCKTHEITRVSEKALPELSHAFTHFQLTITPILVKVNSDKTPTLDSAPRIWYKLDAQLPGGIPTPVATLLKRLHTLEQTNATSNLLPKTE